MNLILSEATVPSPGKSAGRSEDITRTQRPKPRAEDAKGLADVKVGGSERVKVLTDQSEEQEQNSEGVRLQFWTHGSEITGENWHERGRGGSRIGCAPHDHRA